MAACDDWWHSRLGCRGEDDPSSVGEKCEEDVVQRRSTYVVGAALMMMVTAEETQSFYWERVVLTIWHHSDEMNALFSNSAAADGMIPAAVGWYIDSWSVPTL